MDAWKIMFLSKWEMEESVNQPLIFQGVLGCFRKLGSMVSKMGYNPKEYPIYK